MSVDINVDELVYQGHNMDEDLRDHLWNEYEGVAVDEFPAINEESIGNRVRLTVSRPVDKALQPDDCCVWLSFDGSMGLYAAPVRFLGNTVELFLILLNVWGCRMKTTYEEECYEFPSESNPDKT